MSVILFSKDSLVVFNSESDTHILVARLSCGLLSLLLKVGGMRASRINLLFCGLWFKKLEGSP